MSYILDALKKAETQRHLGGVPSIHAAASGDNASLEAQPFWRRHLPWLITGLLGLALLSYVLWSQLWHHAEPVPAALVSAPTPAPAAVAPMEQPRPVPAQETPPPAAPTHAAPAVTAEKPVHVTPPTASAPTDTSKAETAASAAKPAAAPEASTPPAAPEDDPGTAQDLPASIQRELPPVSISGYIYARNPAERSALINKRLLHEGEIVAPDLVLEKLTPRGAILNYKGYRYRVPY